MSGGDEIVLIGPSMCDDTRNFREGRLKRAWQILISSGDVANMHLVVGLSLDLFRKALSCYQNGAFMASILICGVALETLLYDLVSAVKGGVKCERGHVWSIEPDYDIYEKGFGYIIGEARRLGLLDGGLENEINRLRNLRNIVAHYAQRRWKQVLSQPKQGIEHSPSILRGGWANDGDAYKVLENTASIMKDLIEKARIVLCR
jgi:hypothetical protein